MLELGGCRRSATVSALILGFSPGSEPGDVDYRPFVVPGADDVELVAATLGILQPVSTGSNPRR